MNERIRFAIGGLPLPGHEQLSLGTRHPTSTGVVSLAVTVDSNGFLSSPEILPGFGHRSAEKLFEVRDYRSAIMLADRHDWWSAFSGELLVTMAVEQAMRMTVPPRAVLLRTLLAEYARIHSHLGFLSYLASSATAANLWGLVEDLRQGLLALSGNRVHPMLCRVGGLANDASAEWIADLQLLLHRLRQLTEALQRELDGTQRFAGLAILSQEDCLNYGLSGPVARACGLQLDRRTQHYLSYGVVPVSNLTRTAGDAHARFQVLIDEVNDSTRIIDEICHQLAPGDISVRLARRLKVPEGEHLAEVEAPWGIASCLLVSRGGQTPWRVALRTPSLANLSALEKALEGVPVVSLSDAIASVGYTVGDVDR